MKKIWMAGIALLGLAQIVLAQETSVQQRDVCSIYPIALRDITLAEVAEGDSVSHVPLHLRSGNIGWLSWTGVHRLGTLADSLVPPGNSQNYINPHTQELDGKLEIGEWVQGTPGVMNSRRIRDRLDELLEKEIIIPLWSENEQQGEALNYLVSNFAVIVLTDYNLSGRGYLSFDFIGYTECYSQLPQAIDSNATTSEDTETTFILGTTETESDNLVFTIQSPPQHGTYTQQHDRITYQPAQNYFGTDQLTFIVDDGQGPSNTATVLITIEPVNDAPTAEALDLSLNEDTSKQQLLQGDDIDGDELSFAIVQHPTHGTVAFTGNQVTYTPNANYHGLDSFTYLANDGMAESAPAQVDINVLPINDGPIADEQILETPEETAINIVLTGTDIDGDSLAFLVTTEPQHGILSGIAPNLIYTPNADYNGSDSFQFQLNDGRSISNDAMVNITVRPVNDAPVADNTFIQTDEDTAATVVLKAEDIDNTALTFTLKTPPSHGSAEIQGNELVYTPNANYSGSDQLWFVANDGEADSNLAKVDILVAPINDAPKVEDISLTMDNILIIDGQLLGSDIDSEGFNYRLITQPQQGELIISGDTFTFSINQGFNGQVTAQYVANDGEDDSLPATITINISQQQTQNVAPVFTTQPVKHALLGSDYQYQSAAFDANDDALTFSLDAGPAGLDIDPVSGMVSWPTPIVGSHEVSIRVADPAGESDSQVYTIQVLPDGKLPPTIVSTPPWKIEQGETFVYDVDAVDPNLGDELSYSLKSAIGQSTMQTASGEMTWSGDVPVLDGIGGVNNSCRGVAIKESSIFEPALKWEWSVNGSRSVWTTPLVAQTNDDNGDGLIDNMDESDIIFVSFSPGILRILSGADGEELLSVSDVPLQYWSTPAAADLDNDGVIEIVAVTASGNLIAFENDGEVKWVSSIAVDWMGNPSISDIDGDGRAEIIYGYMVFDSDGALVWSNPDAYIGSNHSFKPATSYAVDILPEPGLEVVAGASVISSDGSLLWKNDIVADGTTAVADFDRDGEPEILVVSSHDVYLLSNQGEIIWGPILLHVSGSGGSPTVADLDGDGYLEIGVTGYKGYFVINHDGTLLWSHPLDEAPGSTGSSSFDFNGNGRSEVVVVDQSALTIFDGATGKILSTFNNRSGTAFEYPIVADVDNDSHAEIVIVGSGKSEAGITVLQGKNNDWAPTRSIWNQHAYHVDNINDDLTVPANPTKSWLTHNTFRLNTFPDRHALDLADFRISDVRLIDKGDVVDLQATVLSRGRWAPQDELTVNFYDGDPDQGALKIGSQTASGLKLGDPLVVTLEDVIGSSISSNYLFANIAAPSSVAECETENNTAAAYVLSVSATDIEQLEDEQLVSISVSEVNVAPELTNGQASVVASSGEHFKPDLILSDPNIGDGHLFEMAIYNIKEVSFDDMTPDECKMFHPINGQRYADLGVVFHGNSIGSSPPCWDASGLETLQENEFGAAYSYPYGVLTWNLAMATFDQPQNYVSAIAVSGPSGDPLSKDVRLIAYDIDGNEVGRHEAEDDVQWQKLSIYAEGISRIEMHGGDFGDAYDNISFGRKIESSDFYSDDFHIFTTPEMVGQNIVTITVTDLAGEQDRIEMSMVVEPNKPPQIITQPIGQAPEKSLYQYFLGATDSQGDELTYHLLNGPEGMAVDDQTGEVSWQMPDDLLGNVNEAKNVCQAEASSDVDLAVKWHWEGKDIESGGKTFKYHHVVTTPLAGPIKDTNGDNVLSSEDDTAIVFMAIADRVFDQDSSRILFAIDGSDGSLLWHSSPDISLWANSVLAMADLDRDGKVEIIATGQDGSLYAFNYDGSVRWQTQERLLNDNNTVYWGGIHIADLDADGVPEILASNRVFNADGTLRWKSDEPSLFHTDGFAMTADLDNDGLLEVILGPEVFNHDGSLLWSFDLNDFVSNGFMTVADFSGDGLPEVLALLRGAAYILDSDGSELIPKLPVGTESPANIDDFDGDGVLEFGVRSSADYTVYEQDGSILWSTVIKKYAQQATSRQASVLTDLQGDGRKELIFINEVHLTIIDAVSGFTLFQRSNSADTPYEHPIVADVDNDNHLDIIVPASHRWNNTVTGNSGITVYQAKNNDWTSGRSIWNQHEYVAANINDDMTVPVQPDYWKGEHLARTQPSDLKPIQLQSDIAINSVRLIGDEPSGYSLVVQVANNGLIPFDGGAQLAISSGGGNTSAILTTFALSALEPGQTKAYSWTVPVVAELPSAIKAEVSFAQDAVDCDLSNNAGFSAMVGLSVTDRLTAKAEQWFSVSPLTVPQPPKITSKPNTLILAGLEYTYVVEVEDSNPGDVATFTLKQGPTGMSINSSTGEISWKTLRDQKGTQHDIIVEVVDSAGLIDTQQFQLLVAERTISLYNDGDKQSYVGEFVRYPFFMTLAGIDKKIWDVSAEITGAPEGIVFDTGLQKGLRGTITAEPGVYHTTVKVIDNISKLSDEISFDWVILEGNERPEIHSSPAIEVRMGTDWQYSIKATDPENDLLEYHLVQFPKGMTITNNVVEWKGPEQFIGSYEVVIQVADGNGPAVEQRFTLKVRDFSPVNHPPVVTLPTPDQLKVDVGRSYQYQVQATDPDSDPLSYSLTPIGNNDINLQISASGLITAQPIVDSQVGSYAFEVMVNDSRGASAGFSATLAVFPESSNNQAPVFTSVPPTTVTALTTLSYKPVASDADNDVVTYALGAAPSGVSFDGTTLNWTPTESQTGIHSISIRATDSFGLSTEQSFEVAVTSATPGMPTIISTPPTEHSVDSGGLSYQVEVLEPDDQAVTFALTQAPDGMLIDASSGLVVWAVNNDNLGEHHIELTATDPDGNVASQSFTILVTAKGPWNRRMCR
jgi:hypothetical protein